MYTVGQGRSSKKSLRGNGISTTKVTVRVIVSEENEIRKYFINNQQRSEKLFIIVNGMFEE